MQDHKYIELRLSLWKNVNCRKCRNIFLYLSRLKIATTNNSSSIFSGNLMRLIAFVWVSTNSTLATKVLVLCLIKSYQFCDHSIWKWYSINCTVFLVINLFQSKIDRFYFLLFLFLQLYWIAGYNCFVGITEG